MPTASITIADATVKEQGNLAVFVPGNIAIVERPSGVVFGPDRNGDAVQDLYVLGRFTKNIVVYDGKTGGFIEELASSSSGLNRSAYLTLGPDGAAYTSTDPGSGTRDTVLRIDQTKVVTTFISPSNPGGNGGLLNARGMAFGPDGNFYVASNATNQVLRYNGSTGAFIDAFVTAGSGGVGGPSGILFGPDRNNDSVRDLYVSSNLTDQVLVYSGTDGSFMGVFVAAGSGGLDEPHDMRFGPDGNLFVVASSSTGLASWQVYRFDGTSGSFIDIPIAAGAGQVSQTTFIAFDSNGDLYATNEFSHVILRDQAGPLVTLSESGTSSITVDFSTADGTATHGSDYATVSGRLTFAPGETNKRILVSPVDDGVTESIESFNVNLSNVSGATIADGQGVATILNSQTKFFVIDDGTSLDSTFKYESSGDAIVSNYLKSDDTAPRGAAANAAGTTLWVVDANKNVYVYDNRNILLGSWSAGGLSSSAQIEGIATNGTDIWLLDNYKDKVYKYTGAASLRSGSQSAASSFSLSSSNSNAKGIVTDGTYLWVVNDSSTDKVYKYTVSGTSKGSWTIDAANSSPTGLTINPNNVSDIWIVDSGTKKVYQYTAAAGRTSGSQNAAANFALAAGNTNPQDIADPPVPGMESVSAPVADSQAIDAVFTPAARLDATENSHALNADAWTWFAERIERAGADRVNDRLNGGGLNGSVLVKAQAVSDDNEKDMFTGSFGLDWSSLKKGSDGVAKDKVTELSAVESGFHLDFIDGIL